MRRTNEIVPTIKSSLCLNLKQRCKIVSDSNWGHFCRENIIQILLFASKHKEFANLETNKVACGEILEQDSWCFCFNSYCILFSSYMKISVLWDEKKTASKGQLILKRLFGILNSSKKRTKKIRLNYYDTSGRIAFVRFLEEFKTPRRHFEINWPLVK